MSPIEYTPESRDHLREKLEREVEWLLIQGWQAHREAGQLRLSLQGRADKIVRGGVMIHG